MTVRPTRMAIFVLALPIVLPLPLFAQVPLTSPAAPPSATTVPAPAPIVPSPVAPTPGAPSPPAPAAPATPGVGAAPATPGVPAPGAQAPGAPAVLGATPAPVAPPAPPPAWLPRQTAELQIVEKLDATHRTLDISVGGSAKIDTLLIQVKACVVRPPSQKRDAAAYLDITGKDTTSPLFQGWMLAAEPAASLFEDPLYDVRVIGCR